MKIISLGETAVLAQRASSLSADRGSINYIIISNLCPLIKLREGDQAEGSDLTEVHPTINSVIYKLSLPG